MNRLGSPRAAAMCQPCDVPRLGGCAPATFVAIPLWNGAFCVMTSQKPQKPTYASSPESSTADVWLLGSLGSPWTGSVLSGALASPGWFIVPRS